MDLFEDINREHRLLENAAGTLVSLIHEWIKNDNLNIRKDVLQICNFFTKFMIESHTQKEEKIIFTFLEKLHIPRQKGPLYYYELEHKQHQQYTENIRSFLKKSELTEIEKDQLKKISFQFCAELWEHIDKEDSVLMSEVRERIRGGLLLELNVQYQNYLLSNMGDPSLISEAENLIQKYPPVKILPDVFRGDGCMSCRHYGEGCNGIEHEWWSEHEWEDFFARNNRD